MKKIITIICLVCIPLFAISQTSPVDKLFEKYSGEEGFTSVYISKYMFELFAHIDSEDEDFQEFEEIVSQLTGIKILVSEGYSAAGINFYDEIINEIPISEYKELMVVKEKDQDFKFLIKETDGIISELLMIGGGEENMLLSIQGNIDLKSISK